MVKTLSYLLILPLLILRSEAYAWSCWANINPDGTITEGTLYCDGIELNVFLETWLCVEGNYYQNDPYCSAYHQQSACSDTVDYRTTACTEPNTVGYINESNTYSCATNSWSGWTIGSNNCSPAPQTCFESTEERTVACQSGYSGSILETRSTTCSTPYSDPVIGPWVESTNTCILEATDITNPTSVLNPASPVNPINMVDPVGVTPSIELPSVSPVDESMAMPQMEEQPQEQKTTTDSSTSTSTEVKEEKKEKEESKQESEAKESKIDKKDGFEIIPGFGIGLSLSLIQQPVDFQQQELTNILNLEQEQTYGREQDILLNLIQSDDYSLGFDSLANYRWRSLLHDNPLQSDAFGD